MKKKESLKKNSMYLVAVAIVFLVIIGLVFKSVYRKELTGEDLAENNVGFVDNLELQKNKYSDALFAEYVDCEGNFEEVPEVENQIALNSWALLAYTSMYDMTGEKIYIEKIQNAEDRILKAYKRMIAPDSSINDELPRVDPSSLYSFGVMGTFLLESYEMLKGKEILENEEKIKQIVLDVNFLIIKLNRYFSLDDTSPQTPSMLSSSFSTSVPYLKSFEKYTEEDVKNFKEQSLKFMSVAEEDFVESGLQKCWVLDAKFNAWNNEVEVDYSEEYFVESLSSHLLSEDTTIVPVEIQPCINIYYKLHFKTGNKEYLNQATNLLDELVETSGSECNEYALEAGEVEEDSTSTWLADNAYHIYLISRPGLNEGRYG